MPDRGETERSLKRQKKTKLEGQRLINRRERERERERARYTLVTGRVEGGYILAALV
jgi:hypothetical protein